MTARILTPAELSERVADMQCDPETQRIMALAAKDEHDALVAALEAREAEVEALREAQTRHLELIRDLTQAPLPEDCIEARNRVGVLTAKCATLRNEKEALESRAAELEALVESTKGDYRDMQIAWERALDEKDEATAEVARLREALEQVITKCHHEWCGESAVSEAFCDSCKVARAALGRT